MTEIGNFNPTL